MTYYKIVNANFGMPQNISYKKGINVAKEKMDMWNNHGIYYADVKSIFRYLHYGAIIFQVSLANDSYVIQQTCDIDGVDVDEWRADKVILSEPMSLHEPNVIDKLIAEGADITIGKLALFKWAVIYSPKVWEYLNSKYPILCKQALDEYYPDTSDCPISPQPLEILDIDKLNNDIELLKKSYKYHASYFYNDTFGSLFSNDSDFCEIAASNDKNTLEAYCIEKGFKKSVNAFDGGYIIKEVK